MPTFVFIHPFNRFRTMRKFLVLAAFSIGMMFVATTSVFAQSGENAYRSALEKMLQRSGSLEGSKAVLTKTFSMLRAQYPDVPASFWEEQEAKVTTKLLDKIVDIYLPIYQKYMTLEDMNEIISFYDSPVGKKMTEATPKMMAEGFEISQKVAMEIITEMMQELQAKQKELQGSSKLE